MLLVVIGVLSAYYGVLVGLTQRHPKTVLAYSSISQMGLITVGVGVGFLLPDQRDLVWAAVAAYALHHGFAKGALFLGISVYQSTITAGVRRRLCLAGMILGALALAGVPFTSGALAKTLLKEQVALLPGNSAYLLKILLAIGATGTTLLMLHFLRVIVKMQGNKGDSSSGHDHRETGLWIPWVTLLLCVLFATFLWPWSVDLSVVEVLLKPSLVWAGLWPVIVGVGAVLLLSRPISRWQERVRLNVPAGDILAVFAYVVALIQRSGAYTLTILAQVGQRAGALVNAVGARFKALPTALMTVESMLRSWPVGGGLMIGVFVIILISMLWS
jgi:formate hydrogenlyase subunit 3/multisubunit Na+/H+ antiporter MnhD subunit